MKIISRSLAIDVRWGLAWGLGMTFFLSVVATVTTLGHTRDFAERYGLTFAQLLGSYLVAGTLGGLILGAFRPVTKSRFGAFLIGSVLGITSYWTIRISMGHSSRGDLIGMAVIGTIVGGGLGVVYFDKDKAEQAPP